MIKSLLKNLAKRMLFADEDGLRELAIESVTVGKTLAEKYEFWNSIHEMLQTPGGKGFLALMQREFSNLESQLLDERTPLERRTELLAQLRQQSFVLSFPKEVKRNMLEKLKEIERTSRG